MMSATSNEDHRPVRASTTPRMRFLRASHPGRVPLARRGYLAAIVTVAGVAAAMLTVRERLDVLNVALVFLLLSFALALTVGSGPAALAAVLSFLTLDFLFIPPFHTFSVARLDHLLALVVYFAVAVVTGQLVARVQARTEMAVRERRRTELFYELNAALIGDVTLNAILSTIVERVVHVYGAERSRILLPDTENALSVRAGYPSSVAGIDRQQLAMASWVVAHRAPVSTRAPESSIRWPHGVGRLPVVPKVPDRPDELFLPIATRERVIGVLEVMGRPGGGRFDGEDRVLLTSFANQAALAVERARLTEEAARATALAQSDAFKSTLLTAVSHDLRTPLATIKTSVTSLLDSTVVWPDDDRAEFLHAIDEETDRLARLVGNLLDLSRIEGGVLRPEKEWYDIAELVGDVARRLTNLTGGHRLTTDVEPDLPLACFDYVMIAQVLRNLCENAVKYTPPGTAILMSARLTVDTIEITVSDRGPGIPRQFLPYLFDRFSRADHDERVMGTGLGLAICKGFIEAHGGEIWVESGEGHGTSIRFTLPVAAEPQSLP